MDVNQSVTGIISLGVSFSPIVMMLVEAIKHVELVPHRFLPVVSLLVGLGFGLAAGYFAPDPSFTLPVMGIGGVVAGGMACGIYDLTNKQGKGKPHGEAENYPTDHQA